MATWVNPTCSEPVMRHGRFEVWVLLRRARAESIRAGKALVFPRKPHICPQLSPGLSSPLITLHRGCGPYMSYSPKKAGLLLVAPWGDTAPLRREGRQA